MKKTEIKVSNLSSVWRIHMNFSQQSNLIAIIFKLIIINKMESNSSTFLPIEPKPPKLRAKEFRERKKQYLEYLESQVLELKYFYVCNSLEPKLQL